jgi:hypothetical protein
MMLSSNTGQRAKAIQYVRQVSVIFLSNFIIILIIGPDEAYIISLSGETYFVSIGEKKSGCESWKDTQIPWSHILSLMTKLEMEVEPPLMVSNYQKYYSHLISTIDFLDLKKRCLQCSTIQKEKRKAQKKTEFQVVGREYCKVISAPNVVQMAIISINTQWNKHGMNNFKNRLFEKEPTCTQLVHF